MESIVNLTNVDNEDFVGMYHGEEVSVKEGETRQLTERIANHLAGQLATKMLIRDKTVRNYLTHSKREPLIESMIGGPVFIPAEGPKELPEKEEKKVEKEEFADLKKKPRKKAKK